MQIMLFCLQNTLGDVWVTIETFNSDPEVAVLPAKTADEGWDQ